MAAAGATTTLPPADEQPYDDYDDYEDYEDDKRKGGAGKAALWLLLALGVVGSLILAFWLFNRSDMDTTEVAIPDVVGVSEEEARTTLEDEGFENITTEEQSVSGMKPILISFFSGASEPAAQAPVRTAFGTRLKRPAAVACPRNLRRLPKTGSFIAFSK